MRLPESYDGGMYDTARAWERMLQLNDAAEQKVVTAEEERASATENDLRSGEIRSLGKNALRAVEPKAEENELTETEELDAEEDRLPEDAEESDTEVSDEPEEVESELATQSDPAKRKGLDAWLESVKGTPEEFWEKQAYEVWLDREIAMDSYAPRLDMLVDGAKKILREQVPGLSDAGLEERADLAVKMVLDDLVTQEADVLAGAKLDRKGNRKLAKGWQEKLLHGAYAQMRRQLLDIYGDDSLKGKVSGDELTEDEALAWRTEDAPHPPGTLNMAILYRKYPRREGEGADEYFGRLQNYTRQDKVREAQLKADEEYEGLHPKKEAEPVVEKEGKVEGALDKETESEVKADVVEFVKPERMGVEELLDGQLKGWGKVKARLEGEMKVLPDDHPRKLELLQSFDNLKFAVLEFLANFKAVRNDIEQGKILRRGGIMPDEMGDFESDVSAKQALSLDMLYSDGTLKRGASASKNLRRLKVAEKRAEQEMLDSQQRIDEIWQEASRAVSVEQNRYNHNRELLAQSSGVGRRLKKDAERERGEKKWDKQIEEGSVVVHFPTAGAAES